MTSADHPSNPPAGGRWWRLRNVLLVLCGAAIVAWLFSGFYMVDTNERGVVTRFGKICGSTQAEKSKLPGLHWAWPWPIDRVYTPQTTAVRWIEVGFTTLGEKSPERRRSDMLTGDENILKIMMRVQYKTPDPIAYLFNAEDPHWLVERTVESVVNRLVASLPVDDMLTTAKGRIQIDAITLAQQLLDEYQAGIVLDKGDLQVVDPPVPVQPAFNEVTDAKKDSERTIDQAREYVGSVLPEARGRAQQRISRAEGLSADRVDRARGDANRFLSMLTEYRQAKAITRARLYVDSMERVFSKMKVVIFDPADGEGDSRIHIVE